jgi:protein tyrosine phosphatase (PTP) superfamily phosphohydrolase (DUF442 family)
VISQDALLSSPVAQCGLATSYAPQTSTDLTPDATDNMNRASSERYPVLVRFLESAVTTEVSGPVAWFKIV